MAAVTICSDFGAKKNKVIHCFHCFPIYLPWSDGTRCHDLSFLNVELKPTFSLSSLIFIKRLFSSSSLSTIRVVSSENLRVLIFLPEILIPACASSGLAFRMMHSAYKLNKQGDNIQPFANFKPVYCSMGFPGGSDGKASACIVGDPSSIPGLGRSPGEGNGNPLQYTCLENPMDRGALWILIHGITKSQTWLSDWVHMHRASSRVRK